MRHDDTQIGTLVSEFLLMKCPKRLMLGNHAPKPYTRARAESLTIDVKNSVGEIPSANSQHRVRPFPARVTNYSALCSEEGS